MPLELINLVKGFQYPPSIDDRGFIFNMARLRQAKWTNSATTEAMNLLRSFAEPYYMMKCPEEYDENKSADSKETPDLQEKTSQSSNTKKSYCIQFAIREIPSTRSNCFIATNLADPADFAHFIFTQLAKAQSDSEIKTPDPPFQMFAVQRVCNVRPESIEKTLLSLLEEQVDSLSYPYRFTIRYRNSENSAALPPTSVTTLARNCMWATNPNCVNCARYQDYAIVMDSFETFFYVGVMKDYQRLQGYNSLLITQEGPDRTSSGPDSEDDISDDLTLDEDEERKRKLCIKRRRRAEKLRLDRKAERKAKVARISDNQNCENGDEHKSDS